MMQAGERPLPTDYYNIRVEYIDSEGTTHGLSQQVAGLVARTANNDVLYEAFHRCKRAVQENTGQ